MAGRWIPQEQGNYSQCGSLLTPRCPRCRKQLLVEGYGPKDPKREGLCHQIQRQGFWLLGTNWMQPGMAPGGQGEVGLPNKGVHHLNRGVSGKGGSPMGYPSLLPPPSKKKHQHVAPISLGDGDCVCVGSSRVGRDGAPTLASNGGGNFWLGVRGRCCLISLSCGFPRPLACCPLPGGGQGDGVGGGHRRFTFSTKQ